MIYPGFQPTSYGTTDTTWKQSIQDIRSQTGATWLEIPVLFSQATAYSTSVVAGTNAPGLDAFANGIRAAHALGFHVFFIPLSGVSTPGGWAGIIQFGTEQQEQAWFESYWNTLKPYAEIAQENGVEQMAIGTELQWLEGNAPASLWNELIAGVHSVFKGTLTYDLNWPSLYQAPTSWMKNPDLAMIGISEYISLIDDPAWVDPNTMTTLWHNRVRNLIDAFCARLGKLILISEIGYPNTSDALFNPWYALSTAPHDPAEQAAAYVAALANVFADQHIAGVFFWGWDNVGTLAIKGQPAAQVVDTWYTKHS